MNYVDLGNDTTNNVVMLLHGWGGSSESLVPLAKQLIELGTFERAIVVDLPGFGKSGKLHDGADIYDYADAVIELTKTIGLSDITLIGHSFGGAITVILSEKYPEIVSHTVLLAAAVIRHNRETRLVRTLKRILGDNYEKMKSYAKPMSKLYRKGFVSGSDTGKLEDMQDVYEKIIKQDLTDVASGIKSEVLMIWGHDDKYVPIKDARTVAGIIPNSTLIELKGGHGLPLFKPALVASKINEFLKK